MSRSGCIGQGTSAIFGSIEDSIVYEDILYNITGDGAFQQIVEDPRHQEVATEWRSCLSDRGVEVDSTAHSLLNIAIEYYHDLPEADARESEMTLAESDATCLEETGLDLLRTDLVSEYQESAAGTGDFDTAKAAAFQQLALERAQELLVD